MVLAKGLEERVAESVLRWASGGTDVFNGGGE